MIEIVNFTIFSSSTKKRGIKVFSVGYKRNSDVQIAKVENRSKYKIATIKSLNKAYKIKFKNQLVKNISFVIAALEL